MTPRSFAVIFYRTLRRISGAVFSTLLLTLASSACGRTTAPASSGGPTAAPASTSASPSVDTSPTGATSGTSQVDDFVWTPPVLADHTSACDAGGAPQRKGADYTSQSGRTFHVWAPAGYDASKRWPIVFMFHGWYADGKAFESWFQMENYVNGEAIVVYPDAVNGLWDLNGESDLSFFDEMTKQVGETYCADPRHTYAFGFSYGGKFTNHLACARAGYIRAASIGDGSEGGSYKHCGRLPILFTHRTHDQDEQIAWSRANQRTWVGLDGCSAETDLTNAELSCVTNRGCQSPATLTFCEDTWFDPNWPADWNHTVREPYRAFAWNWLKAH